MRLLKKTLLSTVLICSSISANAADQLMVMDAWIPEMPPVSRVMAGFGRFINQTNKDIEIVSLSSPDFGRIEMHLSKEVDGMARMIPQKSIIVQAKASVELKHGSYHLMLFNPAKRLKTGDSAIINMTLANGQIQSFKAEVRSTIDDMKHDHSHHHHH